MSDSPSRTRRMLAGLEGWLPNGHPTSTREGEVTVHGELSAADALGVGTAKPAVDGVKVTTHDEHGRIVAADVPYAEWIALGGNPADLHAEPLAAVKGR